MKKKKLAIFVEGQTEQIFMRKLLWEIAGAHRVSIEMNKISGGNNAPIVEKLIAKYTNNDAQFEIILYDCGSDNKVVSDILERVDNLKLKGYTKIIGIRDYYPPRTPLKKLKKRLKALTSTANLPIEIIVTVMEIEAWFLAETSHFQRIHHSLTLDRIKEALGIDLTSIDVREVPKPSETLSKIYTLVSDKYAYDKSKRKIEKTVNVLDFNEIYFNIRYQIEELNKLITHLDDFMDF